VGKLTKDKLTAEKRLQDALDHAQTFPEKLKQEVLQVHKESNERHEHMQQLVDELLQIVGQQPEGVLSNDMQRVKQIVKEVVASRQQPATNSDGITNEIHQLQQEIQRLRDREQQFVELTETAVQDTEKYYKHWQHATALLEQHLNNTTGHYPVQPLQYIPTHEYLEKREKAQKNTSWVPSVKSFILNG
jgi:methyl-accepting chemotaxis protein